MSMRLVAGRAWDDGRCVTECARGKYRSAGHCHLCDHTCGTCVDAGPANCTSCDTGEDREARARAGVSLIQHDSHDGDRFVLLQTGLEWSATCTRASAWTPAPRPSTTRRRGAASAAPTTAACAPAPAAACGATPPTTSLTARAPGWSAGKVTQVDPVPVPHRRWRLEARIHLFSAPFFFFF